MVDSKDKLKLNYNSDFYEDYNRSIWLNSDPGLMRNSRKKIAIVLGFASKFDNNRLSLETAALTNNPSGSITLDNKQRLELNYLTDMRKDFEGKIWLKLGHKLFKRDTTHDGNIPLNIDDSTLVYDQSSKN